MKRSKKKKQFQKEKAKSIEVKINSFLSKLGIKKTKNRYKEETAFEILDKEGIDYGRITKQSDAFSATINNSFFTNIKTTERILSLDYDRFFDILKELSSLKLPETPNKICDIGSGPGVISLWLAQMYPESLVTAIDHSENAINAGKVWADRLGLKNINFKSISYEKAAIETAFEKFDFIFSTAFINLGLTYSTTLFKDLRISDLPGNDTKPIQNFISACKNLVSKKGMIYLHISTHNNIGLLTLLNFVKEYGLGIDWNYSNAYIRPKRPNEQYDIPYIDLFLRPGLSCIVEDPWEAWLALTHLAEMDRKPITLTPAKFETYFNLLSDGLKIVDIDLEVTATNSKEKILLYSKAGLYGFFRISEKFLNIGIVNSVGAIYEILEKFEEILSRTNYANFNYVHPFALPLVVNSCVKDVNIEVDCELEEYFQARKASEIDQICKGNRWETAVELKLGKID